jgi:hypothetical protein
VPVAYWIFTLVIAAFAIGPGIMDILHLPPLYAIMLHLGYPKYFGPLLGAWKVLGGLAVLVPRYPLVKEWTYAGMFFEFSSAVISHLARSDGALALLGPIALIGALATSWYLRPTSRRLASSVGRETR